MLPRTVGLLLPLACLTAYTGCNGPQSTFTQAGEGARQITQLFYWMVGGGVGIWLIVMAIIVLAIRSKKKYDPRITSQIVIGGGFFFPTIVLTGLLCYGLSILPALQAPAPEGSLTIDVAGVRWWWRVHYRDEQKAGSTTSSVAMEQSVHLANEIVLPVNEPVEFKLTSEDVIHSFWIPALGGKVDMIPGRRTRLKLLPVKVGIYRGVCAEFCGEAHSQMGFTVKVVTADEFRVWRDAQRLPVVVKDSIQKEGLQLFLSRGCGACHTIRGTVADGVVGPDLTHVGSRSSLGAGWLSNDVESFRHWLIHTDSIKPGVEMPQFDSLSDHDSWRLAEFLEGLQ